MTKMISIINAETGETIEREMTAEEAAEHEAVIAERLAIKAENEAKIAQRQAILEKLGLSEEEAKLLLA